jgi:hypothetical protein
MQILNGKWVDSYEDSIDYFNFEELQQIAIKVKCMYGEKITHDRIKIIIKLESLTSTQETTISELLENQSMLTKLL